MTHACMVSLKVFFILELAKKYLYTRLHVPLTGHITIWHILGENKSMRSEPQDIGLAFDVLTPKLPCLTRFSNIIFETSVVKWVNSDQVSLVVTCTAARLYMSPSDNSGWKVSKKWAIWNKYKLRAVKNDARLPSLKAFFILEQRNIYTRGYMSLRRDI